MCYRRLRLRSTAPTQARFVASAFACRLKRVSDVCLSGLTQTGKSTELCNQTFLELFDRASRRQGGTMKRVGLFNRLANYWWHRQGPHNGMLGFACLAAVSLFLVVLFDLTPCTLNDKTIEGVQGF